MVAKSSCAWLFWLAFCCWYCVTLTGGRTWISIDSSSSEEGPPSINKDFYCTDRMKNKDETDIDCGGLKCPKCKDMKTCKTNCDCISDVCQNNKCVRSASCDDKIKNQDETDIDCGGLMCPKCEDAKTCKDNCDCISDICKNNTCIPSPSCKDKIKNQDETDIDCGGLMCPKCEDTKKCNQSCDCISGFCNDDHICSVSCVPECKNGGTCNMHRNCTCTTDFSGPSCEVQSVGLCRDNDAVGRDPILLVTFGSGLAQYSTKTPANFNFSTTYNQTFQPVTSDGMFSFVNSINNDFFDTWHTGAKDHTEDTDGYMLLVNADYEPGQFYNGTVDNLCVGLRYEFSVYLANVCTPTDRIEPNVRFEVRGLTTGNPLLAQLRSGNIPVNTNLQWKKYGLSFIAPSSTVVLLMISDAPGGIGNDIVIDDIALRVCSHNGTGFCPTH